MNVNLLNVTKCFNGTKILNNISLNFSHGKFTTLLGPSGCGKTTILRIIAGLESPDTGSVLFDGSTVFSSDKNINLAPNHRNLSMVFQDFALWPHMTIFENIAFGIKPVAVPNNRKKEIIKQKVMDVLTLVQLNGFEKRYPHELSGGQQQRVSFARAIAVEPKIILFDEPFSALDALLREEMRIEMSLLVKSLNLTAIFVTHDQVEAMAISDEIVVLDKSVIIQTGTPQEIYQKPKNSFVSTFVGKSNFLTKNSVVRPEHLSLDKIENALVFQGEVINSIFIGAGYEVMIKIKDKGTWFLNTPKHIEKSKVNVYVRKEMIHSIS